MLALASRALAPHRDLDTRVSDTAPLPVDLDLFLEDVELRGRVALEALRVTEDPVGRRSMRMPSSPALTTMARASSREAKRLLSKVSAALAMRGNSNDAMKMIVRSNQSTRGASIVSRSRALVCAGA